MSKENRNSPEISDAIVSFDPETLTRRPVMKSDVLRQFSELRNRAAMRVVEKIPDNEGVLDPAAVDQLLITSHCEMQRMSEEFQHGKRVGELLKPIVKALCEGGLERKIRIVDIGCGTGFVVRWLTAKEYLGNDVEVIGVDFNEALINEARRLALNEKLNCTFIVANAFRLDQPADVFLSTGILHHFRGDGLANLFKQHRVAQAFVHFDFHCSPMAPFGSWLFHAVRMREPWAKHDGVLSAVRAHPKRHLLEVAKTAAPEFVAAIYGTSLWRLPVPRVFHSLVGIRPVYHQAFVRNMGNRIASLGKIG